MTAFADLFGRAPDIGWRAPGRVNLVGEHTDYNDGFVLPFAIPREVRVRAARRSDRRLRVASMQAPGVVVEVALDELEPGSVPGWAAYTAGVAWAIEKQQLMVAGADLLIDGDVPQGAGLSSSAAVECAVAGALLWLSGHDLGLADVARIAQHAESGFLGVPCGIMDQFVATHARAGHVLLLDTRSMAFRHIPFDMDSEGLALVVIDTRAAHSLADGQYADRRAACEAASTLLGVSALRDVDDLDDALLRVDDRVLQRRVRHVVTENRRVQQVAAQLEGGHPREIGPVLTASHRSLRDDFEVSCPELDGAVDAALGAGALGARMTGGGFGGSVIALVDSESVHLLERQVTVAFDGAGFREPGFLTVDPADGFGRWDP